jgi:hypothetical protein
MEGLVFMEGGEVMACEGMNSLFMSQPDDQFPAIITK